MSEGKEGVSFIPGDTPYLDIRPRKFDVTISLYGVPGRLFGTVREMIMNIVPANIDINISSEEVGTDYESHLDKSFNPTKMISVEDALDSIVFSDGSNLSKEKIDKIGSALLKKGII